MNVHIIQTSHIWHIDYQADQVTLWLASPEAKGVRITPNDPRDSAHLEDLNALVAEIISAKGGFVTLKSTLKYNA
jgi:hypothetical protein